MRSVGVSEEGSVVSMTTNENNVVTVSTNNNTIFGWDLRYTTTLHSTQSLSALTVKKDNATESSLLLSFVLNTAQRTSQQSMSLSI